MNYRCRKDRKTTWTEGGTQGSVDTLILDSKIEVGHKPRNMVYVHKAGRQGK